MSLEDLIAQATKRKFGSKCWASYLDGDAKRFVQALEELEEAQPGTVNRRQAKEILESEFGVVISRETARNHFAGDCRCGR